MKKSIPVLIAILLLASFGMSACSNKGGFTDDGATTTAVAVKSVSEDDAKAVALEKAGITESAAENLVVKETEFEGEKSYLVTFEWSGFEYEITVSASTGNIVHYIFDGDEMKLN